nr:hypothetical protein [Tanacetum cinerariifolium]
MSVLSQNHRTLPIFQEVRRTSGKLWEHMTMRPEHQDPNALDNMKPFKRYCFHKFTMSSCYVKDVTEMQSLEINEMLRIRLHEAGSNEEIFTSVAWIRAFNINEPIYAELCHEFYSTYEFDEVYVDDELQTKKIINFRLGGRAHSLTLLELLEEDVVRSLGALIYCRDLDTTTLRDLIDSYGKLILEDPQPGVPKVVIPRPPKASMQDLYDTMCWERMVEVKQIWVLGVKVLLMVALKWCRVEMSLGYNERFFVDIFGWCLHPDIKKGISLFILNSLLEVYHLAKFQESVYDITSLSSSSKIDHLKEIKKYSIGLGFVIMEKEINDNIGDSKREDGKASLGNFKDDDTGKVISIDMKINSKSWERYFEVHKRLEIKMKSGDVVAGVSKNGLVNLVYEIIDLPGRYSAMRYIKDEFFYAHASYSETVVKLDCKIDQERKNREVLADHKMVQNGVKMVEYGLSDKEEAMSSKDLRVVGDGNACFVGFDEIVQGSKEIELFVHTSVDIVMSFEVD